MVKYKSQRFVVAIKKMTKNVSFHEQFTFLFNISCVNQYKNSLQYCFNLIILIAFMFDIIKKNYDASHHYAPFVLSCFQYIFTLK